MTLHLPKALALGLAGAAVLALGGCYDDGYGYGGVEGGAGYYGGGYGYDGYGAGYADGYGYDGFGYGYGGYGYPGYGWFDGFYYPGSGFYVYDRGGHRRSMRDNDRQHWQGGPGRQGQAANGLRRGGQGSESAPPPPGAPRPGQGQWQGNRSGYRAEGASGHWQQGGQQGVVPQGVVSQGTRSAPAIQRGAGGVGRYPGRRGH